MKKIDKLNEFQTAQLSVYRDRWIKIGLSCEPCDLEAARPAVEETYRDAGLDPPALVMVVDSPISGAIAPSVLTDHMKKIGKSLDAITLDESREIADTVSKKVKDQVEGRAKNPVKCTKEEINQQIRHQVFLSHNASWAGWCRYYAEVCDLELPLGMTKLCEMSGWGSFFKECCILQHRHSELHLDEDGRLHNESGMAAKYRDGFGVWSIHGVSVDEQIVMNPETQTIKQIEKENDVEVKRIRIERYGWGKYLEGVGADIIDSRYNERDAQEERLYQLADGTKRVSFVDPSTGRRYFQGVPRDINDCESAQLWMSHGLDALAIHRS